MPNEELNLICPKLFQDQIVSDYLLPSVIIEGYCQIPIVEKCPILMTNKPDPEINLRLETFYQNEEKAIESYKEDRLHSAHRYTYNCDQEQCADLLSKCFEMLKTIDEDLLQYISDSEEAFAEFSSKVKIIGEQSFLSTSSEFSLNSIKLFKNVNISFWFGESS